MKSDPLLEVNNLKTQFKTDRGVVKAVDGISYTIERGEIFGVVGESGAGKSVTGLSILDLIDSPGEIVEGEIIYKGENLLDMSKEEIRSIRGNEIAVVFQDSTTALNPSFTIGSQISDIILEHNDISEQEARDRVVKLLKDVDIPNAEERIDEYPHQFSGGMRQRALIAMALSCDPELIIADEITTGIDVTTQANILELLSELQDKHDLSMQFITHDMGVIAELCDRLGVMYAGKLIEVGSLDDIFQSPRHPYTVGLLKSLPQLASPKEKLQSIPGTMPDLIDVPSGCAFRDRCEHATEECAQVEPEMETVGDDHKSACLRIDEIDWSEVTNLTGKSKIKNMSDGGTKMITNRGENITKKTVIDADHLKKYFNVESQSWIDSLLNEKKYVHAVDDVSLNIREGDTVGLVGESGCGKTTLGRTLTQLYEPDKGTVLFSGQNISQIGKKELRNLRSEFQVIFQDPFSSLNPRRKVKNIIGRPMEIHDVVNNEEEKIERVKQLLTEVGLEESHLDRYAHEFSGGQKQRIGIARALAVEPDFIVADEPVSALDVSVQAKILNLLMDLQEKYNLTYLFIAHDINVVKNISDRIVVMYLGQIVEKGTVDEVFSPPYHPYTEILLSSVPDLQPGMNEDRKSPKGELPDPADPPSGCRFHTRCPYAEPECKKIDPPNLEQERGHEMKCHIFDDKSGANLSTDIEEIIAQQSDSVSWATKGDKGVNQ